MSNGDEKRARIIAGQASREAEAPVGVPSKPHQKRRANWAASSSPPNVKRPKRPTRP